MPLVAAAAIAYAAGLLTGFGGAVFWTSAAAVLVLWLGARRSSERLALAAIAAGGLAIGASEEARELACRRQLVATTEWQVKLAGEAAPGAFVRGRHACGVVVRLSVRKGRAAPGALVHVRGMISERDGSLMVAPADLRVVRGPGLLPRWRARIGRGIDSSFGTSAPLVRALLIADMDELSPSLRQRFAAAGLSHMLSVSGLHVGLIAVAVSLLGQIAGLARKAADSLTVGITAAYVLVIGAPLPAVRAAAMLGAVSLGVAVQRPTSPWAVLAVGSALPLLAPGSVLDLGYQLSVVGMVALVAAGAFNSRVSWLSEGGWRGSLKRSVVTSTAATLLTAPLVAATFGKTSLVAPASNLVAVPIMAVLQPMLFLAAALLPFEHAAGFVADACQPLLGAIDWIASAAARLPGASVIVATDSTSIALACAVAAALVVAAVSRFPGRALVVAAALMSAFAWRPVLSPGDVMTELHMIDVGQGDAIALRTRSGNWVLFDAGRAWHGGDAGQREVVPYISDRGGSVTAFVLSHPHSDHVGGAASALLALRPSWYFDPGYAGASGPYRESLVIARETGTRWQRLRPGDSLALDEALVTFLAPDSAWVETQNDANLASTVARITVGSVAFLLTGDAEAAEEGWLLDHRPSLLSADVLKVAHHGSNTSTTPAFLDAVKPALALVSVGQGNMYGHPSADVMRSLAAGGVMALRTDVHGTIVVRTDGYRIEVEAGGERWWLKR